MEKKTSIEGYICSILLSFMSVLMFTEVVSRYFFNHSIFWAEELIRYMFIWLTFLGSAYCIPEKGHVVIDMFISLFPKSIQKYMEQLGNLVWLGLSIFIIYYSGTYTLKLMKLGERSTALKLPLWIVYAAIPVGFIFMVYRLVQLLYKESKEQGKPDEA